VRFFKPFCDLWFNFTLLVVADTVTVGTACCGTNELIARVEHRIGTGSYVSSPVSTGIKPYTIPILVELDCSGLRSVHLFDRHQTFTLPSRACWPRPSGVQVASHLLPPSVTHSASRLVTSCAGPSKLNSYSDHCHTPRGSEYTMLGTHVHHQAGSLNTWQGMAAR
jgi:hypothetical protein